MVDRPQRIEDGALDALLSRIDKQARAAAAFGRVADYIPALARVPAEKFGLAVVFADGREVVVGDADEPFSIQSCSKVFSLAFALEAIGERLWERVGREPSGMSFNSLLLLEQEGGRPRNPLINAGAIATIDALLAFRPDWPVENLERMRALAASQTVHMDEEVYASERESGHLNRAIAWFLKAKGNLLGHPEPVVDAYFRICATAMSARQLARAGRWLIGPEAGESFCDADKARRVRAVMRTCGLYDAAGEFAYRVGLPAKSGVGGGILAVSPGRYTVCAWSPALDDKGNSAAGFRALELLVEALDPEDRRG